MNKWRWRYADYHNGGVILTYGWSVEDMLPEDIAPKISTIGEPLAGNLAAKFVGLCSVP